MRKFLTEIYNIWIAERPKQMAAALAYYGMFSFAEVIKQRLFSFLMVIGVGLVLILATILNLVTSRSI